MFQKRILSKPKWGGQAAIGEGAQTAVGGGTAPSGPPVATALE